MSSIWLKNSVAIFAATPFLKVWFIVTSIIGSGQAAFRCLEALAKKSVVKPVGPASVGLVFEKIAGHGEHASMSFIPFDGFPCVILISGNCDDVVLLEELHRNGTLTKWKYEAAKAKVLGTPSAPPML